jgi:hypothetical protein
MGVFGCDCVSRRWHTDPTNHPTSRSRRLVWWSWHPTAHNVHGSHVQQKLGDGGHVWPQSTCGAGPMQASRAVHRHTAADGQECCALHLSAGRHAYRVNTQSVDHSTSINPHSSAAARQKRALHNGIASTVVVAMASPRKPPAAGQYAHGACCEIVSIEIVA